MRRLGTFLAGLGLGMLVGAVFALLFAPQSGLKFREEIESDILKLRDEIDAAMEEPHIQLE